MQWMELDPLYLLWAASLSSQQYLPLFYGIYMCSMKYTVHEVILPVICGYLSCFCSCKNVLYHNFAWSVALLWGNSSNLLFSSGHFQLSLFQNICLALSICLNSFLWFWILHFSRLIIGVCRYHLWVFLVTPLFILDTEKSSTGGDTQNFVSAGKSLL